MVKPFVATCLIAASIAACGRARAPERPPSEPPIGLIGELRQLHRIDELPRYRPGSVVAQESSYDRTGGNDDGFAGTYSSLRREGDALVLADLEGPGVVHRIWTPTPTERMVAFYFDGEGTPRVRVPFIDLFSGAVEPFVRPIVGNEVGGYYCYLPIPYARSLKIVYEGDDIRFHQIQYRRYPHGTGIESFRTPLAADAARELERAIDAWNRPGRRPWADDDVELVERRFAFGPGGEVELFRLREGGRIVGIEIEHNTSPGSWVPGALIEAWWDDEQAPAILSPAADFFGHAFGSPSARSVIVGSRENVDYCYLPMPFARSASIRLRSARPSGPGAPMAGTARVFYSRLPRDPTTEGRLFAVWRREAGPAEGQPYTFLDTAGRGHYVGTLLQAQGLVPGMTQFFEGDDVATVDGEMRLHGTGSEDYFNGGWYALLDRWDGPVGLPIHGSLAYSLPLARTGGYRFYLTDKISFDQTFALTIEHGPDGDAIAVDYTSVAFYYGDRPPRERMDPAGFAEAPRPPGVHEFYPQLMSLSLGSRTSTDYTGGFIGVSAEAAATGALASGRVRIDVSEVPAGRYRVRLWYERGPNGAEFSMWRRQLQISPWTSSYADAIERVERADMGEVVLTDQIRTITVRTRGRDGRRLFRFNRLVLEDMSQGRAP